MEKEDNRIEFSKIVSLVFVLSAICPIIGGYLYNKLFLNFFSINASNFFSLKDYYLSLLYSGHLWHAFFMAVVLIVSAKIGKINKKRKPYIYNNPVRKFLDGLLVLVFISLPILGLFSKYYRWPSIFFLCFFVMLPSFYVKKKLAVYFKDFEDVLLLLASILFFCTFISIDASRNAKKIKLSTPKSHTSRLLIAKNNQTLFFFNKQQNKPVILFAKNPSRILNGKIASR